MLTLLEHADFKREPDYINCVSITCDPAGRVVFAGRAAMLE